MSLLDRSSSDHETRSQFRPRRMLGILGGGVLLVLLCVAGLIVWATSEACENFVRRELIAKMEAATGGRVEIASFHWRPFRLEADAGGIVIHGREAATEAPYAQIGRVHVGISVLGFFSPRILLRDLEINQPAVHLIVYADGSTNQPRPRAPSTKSGLGTFFDLCAGHVAIEQGMLNFESRSADFDAQNRHIPLDFTANDVSTLIAYVPAAGKEPEAYRIEAGAHDMRVTRGDAAKPVSGPAEGYAQATLDLTRNAAYLRSLRLTSESKPAGEHALNVSGALLDFSRPSWQVKAQGELDMHLLDATTGYSNSPEGLVRLDLTGQGHDGQFRVDGVVHVDDGSYVAPGVNARGIGLDAHVHADPEQLLITSVVARLRQGGRMEGTVALDHWLPVIPGTALLEPATTAAPVKHWGFGHKQPAAPPRAASLARPASAPLLVNGNVTAQMKGVTLDAVLDIVGRGPFERLGIDARLNGPATATWTKGDIRTLAVGATLNLWLALSGGG